MCNNLYTIHLYVYTYHVHSIVCSIVSYQYSIQYRIEYQYRTVYSIHTHYIVYQYSAQSIVIKTIIDIIYSITILYWYTHPHHRLTLSSWTHSSSPWRISATHMPSLQHSASWTLHQHSFNCLMTHWQSVHTTHMLMLAHGAMTTCWHAHDSPWMTCIALSHLCSCHHTSSHATTYASIHWLLWLCCCVDLSILRDWLTWRLSLA